MLPGGVCAGPGRVQAASRGLCWPREGAGRQEGSVPALGGYRPAGGVCAGPGRPPGGIFAGLGRVQAARRRLCRHFRLKVMLIRVSLITFSYLY